MAAAAVELERGREAYDRRAWREAYESLSAADQAEPLAARDLELQAISAYMLGRESDFFAALERSHQAYLEAGQPLRAVRCAFWIGINLALGGEMARASGWLSRAQRLLDREQRDSVEHGYLLLPLVFQREGAGDWEAAVATASDAAAVGDRLGDRDLFALAAYRQGHILIKHGRIEEGLPLLDEAMVAATVGDLSPIVTGIVYCGVILACREAYELRRAQEWTSALTEWCELQPDMVAFTGRCLLHRAEIMQLRGAWREALAEAGRATERQGMTQWGAAQAFYLQGEIHRLRGELAAAEQAYREANRRGSEPQPGLALLRMTQGRGEAAAAAMRRTLDESAEPLQRARLLPAFVEIMLALGDLEAARDACRELERIASGYASEMLGAAVAQARGAVYLAEGDARAALVALRQASQVWGELGAPYEVARVRVLVAQACEALGDDDTAALELEAARAAFAELRAAPDLVRLESLRGRATAGEAHGLTPRELEVLRLVASGETNKAIAAQLVVSVRTVDRHVSNILSKLGVSSRAAATAYAHEHGLVGPSHR